MTATPKTTLYRVEQEFVPAEDLMRGHAKFEDFVDSGADYKYGKSRSQVLIKSYKKFFKANPSSTWGKLMHVEFTEQEEKEWQSALPDLSMEAIASYKRWGLRPETAAFFRAEGISRTGHNIYDALGSKERNMEYFLLCRSWVVADYGKKVESKKVSADTVAVYDATYRSVTEARQSFADDGVEMSYDQVADYVGWARVPRRKIGAETMIVSRVSSSLALSLLRNNIPPEYLRMAWECGYRSYAQYTRLIGAYMDGAVTLAQMSEYERLIENGREPDDLEYFIQLASSGIPFEYLAIIA